LHRQSVRRFPPCAPLTTTNRAPKAIGSSFRESLRTTSEAESFLRQSSRRPRARPTRNTLKATRVLSRAAQHHYREQILHDGWGDRENPYFTGLSFISTCSENNRIPTPHALSFNRILCSRGSALADIGVLRVRLPVRPNSENDSANRRGKNSRDLRCLIRRAFVTRT
jgi:hypothetical protein